MSPRALAGLILAVLAMPMAGTLYTNWRTDPEIARPDPFTGSDARVLEDRLRREIEYNRRELTRLQEAVDRCLRDTEHPDAANLATYVL